MCYNISTGLFDTNIRRLYMYDKPGQLYQPPRKSRMVDRVLFEKEIDFCMTFVLATGRPTTHGVGAEALDIYESKAHWYLLLFLKVSGRLVL